MAKKEVVEVIEELESPIEDQATLEEAAVILDAKVLNARFEDGPNVPTELDVTFGSGSFVYKLVP